MRQKPKKLRVGSFDFTPATFSDATRTIVEIIQKINDAEKGTSIHFANANNIALAENDASYQNTINVGDLVFTDGVPVVCAAKRIHPQDKWERVYGPDVTEWILSSPELSETAKPYSLGATQETMEKLLKKIATRFPRAQVVSHYCPPFHEPTAQALTEHDQRIKDAGATVVWVGLGTPKQGREVNRYAETSNVTAMAVGAAFDFLAEPVPQAPVWIEKSGSEWGYRLVREAKRLAKRYFWGNPQFIKSVIPHWGN
jgi:N-acetylglucosaminyldiphosphoundecaprenol N-acetyl-beta-D-mannosaminyltransferase